MTDEFKISEETARSLLESRGYEVSKQVPLSSLCRTFKDGRLAEMNVYDPKMRGGDSSGLLTVKLTTQNWSWNVNALDELIIWLGQLRHDMGEHHG